MTRIVVKDHPAHRGRWYLWQLLDANDKEIAHGRATTRTAANAAAVDAQEKHLRTDGEETSEMVVEMDTE